MSSPKHAGASRFRIRDSQTFSKGAKVGSFCSTFTGNWQKGPASPVRMDQIRLTSPVKGEHHLALVSSDNSPDKAEEFIFSCLNTPTLKNNTSLKKIPTKHSPETSHIAKMSETGVNFSKRKSSMNLAETRQRKPKELEEKLRKSHTYFSASPSLVKLPPLLLNQKFMEKAGIHNQEEERKKGIWSLSRFRLGKTLGEGAFSVVKEATDRENLNKVALKLYDKEKIMKNEQKLDNLASEIKVLRAVQHPNIIKLYNFFETDSYVVLVMELFDGMTLGEIIRAQEDNTINEFEARHIFKQLLIAVQHCHRLGVAHRDIKMSNVMVSRSLGVKLIDFGFAVMLSDMRRPLDLKCGTSYYMPPEIAKNLSYLGGPADIWSLGVVLFTITNGYYPFGDPQMKLAEIYKEINSGVLKFRKNLSYELQDFISSILRHEPLSRPPIERVLDHVWVKLEEASPGLKKSLKSNSSQVKNPKLSVL